MSHLTGRQLVGELQRLGLGTWTPDAVRQWIREEPPCPIAEPADQGKPHRYALLDVLHWLQARTARDRNRGYTTAGAEQLVERLQRVIAAFVTSGSAPQAAGLTATLPATPTPVPSAELFAPGEPAPTPLSPAKPAAPLEAFDFGGASELEAVLEVVRTNRPQAWKAVEEALNQRRKRLEAEGKLVPIDDVQRTVDTQALAMRSVAQALVMPLAQRIPDTSTLDQRRLLIQSAIDGMLQRLADEDTEALASGEAEASA